MNNGMIMKSHIENLVLSNWLRFFAMVGAGHSLSQLFIYFIYRKIGHHWTSFFD